MTDAEDIIAFAAAVLAIIAIIVTVLGVLALAGIYLLLPVSIIYYGVTQEHALMIALGIVLLILVWR